MVRSVGGYSVLAQEPPRCEHLTVDSAEGDADARSRNSDTDTLLAACGKSPAAFDRPCIPAELRCPSVTYAEYAPSSRLVSRAPDRSRCDAGFHYRLLVQAQAPESPTRMTVPPLQVNSLTLVLYLVGSSVPWLGQNDAGTRYSTPDCSQIVHGCVVSLLAPTRGGIASAAIMRRE